LGAARAQGITVFAAASLTNAIEDAARAYRAATGKAVRLSFAASSALARQIEQGAPAAVYVSADEQWMDYVARRGLIVAATRATLLSNRLVLVVPATDARDFPLRPGFDFAAVLGAGGRLACGDPAHVPAGRYAQQALTWLGAWPAVERRLVRADNVRVALAYVERGEVPAGIVYATDAALSSKVRVAGTFPAASHVPITYPAAVVARNDSPAAREFLAYLRGDTARAIFVRYGFGVR
jgi:molybdate transport system substrate-binding protein